MKRSVVFLAVTAAFCVFSCFGQTISIIGEVGPSNQELVAAHASARRVETKAAESPSPRVVVFIGDRVIPHFIDGAGWQTAITVVNLENHPTSFDVLFFKDNGTDLYVPVTGLGLSRGVHIELVTAGSMTFETTGVAASLASGWALLSQTNQDSVGMFGIFRQSPLGGQPQEAVVPAVNQFNSHFVLPFDNTGPFVTGVALANPTLNPVVIPVRIHDEKGAVIDTQQFSLGAYSHAAFVLPSNWTSTAGRRGVVEFQTTGFGVGALGLRFNGLAFTSLNVLENIAWK
jgi:hypothetical protein